MVPLSSTSPLLVCLALFTLFLFFVSTTTNSLLGKSTAKVSFRSDFTPSSLITINSSPDSKQKGLLAHYNKRNFGCNLLSFVDRDDNDAKIVYNPIQELRCMCELLFVRVDQARKTRGNDFAFPHRFSLEVQQRNDYFVCLGLHTSGSIVRIFPHPDAASQQQTSLLPSASKILLGHKARSGVPRHDAVRSYFQKVMNQLKANNNYNNNNNGKAAVFFLSVHDAAHLGVGMAEELWAMKTPLMSWNVHRKHSNISVMFPDLYFLESGGYAKAKQQREMQMQSERSVVKERGKEKEMVVQRQQKEMQKLGNFDELINKVVWRGSSTGFDDRGVDETNMDDLPRAKLCLKARDFSDILDAKMTQFVQIQSSVAKHYKQEGLAASGMSPDEMSRYRGQIDIDGNANAWNGCFQKLLSPSITLKVAGEFEQWYYGKLKAWEHYVPVREDMDDLKQKVQWVVSNQEGLLGDINHQEDNESFNSDNKIMNSKANVVEWKRSIAVKSTEFVMGLTVLSAVEESANEIAGYFFEPSKHPIVIGSEVVV